MLKLKDFWINPIKNSLTLTAMKWKNGLDKSTKGLEIEKI